MVTKLGMVASYNKKLQLIKSHNPLNWGHVRLRDQVMLRDQLDAFYLH